jgi:hypothetical protein
MVFRFWPIESDDAVHATVQRIDKFRFRCGGPWAAKLTHADFFEE